MRQEDWLPPLQPLSPSQVLWRLCNHYQMRFSQVLKEFELTYLQFSIMAEVLDQPRGVAASYKQLSVALDVNERRIARAARDLFKKGLIRNYYADIFDNRALLVMASPRTVRKISELLSKLELLESDLASKMGPTVLGVLREMSRLRTEPPEPLAKACWWRQTHHPGSAWRR